MRLRTPGDLSGTDGAVTTDIGYTGQRRDHATGLMYYYDRLAAGSPDPTRSSPNQGNPQDLNRYSYFRNNPPHLHRPLRQRTMTAVRAGGAGGGWIWARSGWCWRLTRREWPARATG